MRLTRDSSAAKNNPTDFARLALIGVIALALLLRLYGIGWALPTAIRLFSYHPDESMVVGAALQVDPLHFQFDPRFYNYGPLSILLDAWAITLGHLTGLVASSMTGLPSASELLAARLVTALLGAFTGGFLYGAGRIAYSKTAGLIAAMLYAIAPLAVQHGHWATVDVPATFWIAGGLYFAVRASSRMDGRGFDLLRCGVFAGLATATKYNGGLVVLSGLAAMALRRELRTPINATRLFGGLVVAFLIGCPTVFLNPMGMRTGLLFEANHVAQGDDEQYRLTPPGFVYHIAFNLNWGLTLPLLAIALLGAIWAGLKRRDGDIVLLAFAIPYYILIGLAQIKFARYTLPLLPPLLLFVGGGVASIVETRRRVAIFGGAGILAVATVWALLFAIALDRTMTRPDTRDLAAAYIHRNLVTSVGFGTGPWFFSPPLAPLLASPIAPNAKRFAVEATNPRLVPADPDWSFDSFGAVPPDVVALSEYEYTDAIRLHQTDAAAFLSTVSRDYPRHLVFAQPIEVFGIQFTNPEMRGDELPRQKLPIDMLYTNPTTVLYLK